MIRFVLILAMTITLSSQAVATVKWNNSSGSSNPFSKQVKNYPLSRISMGQQSD